MTHHMAATRQPSWTRSLQRGVNTVAKTLGAVHSAYSVGKALYGLARGAAPYAAAGALLL
jgi:hypothetical protein